MARFEREQLETAYRIYMTDSLWGLSRGKSYDIRYKDFIDPPPEETRTSDEIIAHIKGRLEEVK